MCPFSSSTISASHDRDEEADAQARRVTRRNGFDATALTNAPRVAKQERVGGARGEYRAVALAARVGHPARDRKAMGQQLHRLPYVFCVYVLLDSA